jgi:hypothetical protein
MDGLHVSLDLETLDTRQSAVVVAVGAVFFTADQVFTGYPLYRQLQLEPQFQAGRTISEQTLCFWMDQPGAARRSTFLGKQKVHPTTMFDTLFGQWSERWGVGLYGEMGWPKHDDQVQGWWTCGPSFDTAIMENMAAQFKVRLPHRYGDPRDLRTLRDMLPKNEWPERDGTYHNALDDAIYQARLIQRVWANLRADKAAAECWYAHLRAEIPAPGAATDSPALNAPGQTMGDSGDTTKVGE